MSVTRPCWERKFLGFSCTSGPEPKRRIAPEALERFEDRIRELTKPTHGRSFRDIVAKLNTYLSGWIGYFGFAQTKSVIKDLNGWIRRRLRSLIWRQWKTWKRRSEQLLRLGLDERTAKRTAATRYGPWPTSNTRPLKATLTNAYFARLGLIELRVT